jgi:ABC-type uncharacterized transport system involved in gliding motility auxiliary subunit
VEELTMKQFFAFLLWIGMALVVGALALHWTHPVWSQRLAIAGLVVVGLYTATQWREMGRSFGDRNVKYGSMAASGVLLVLAILVGINWVANRQNKRWDLTAGGQFTLSDQTKQILANLKQPLTVRVFYVGDVSTYRDRLNEYSYLSKQVNVEYVEARQNPLESEKYKITSAPTIILEHGDKTERATSVDEQALTNALKKVLEGKVKKVYFVQGHGEHDLADGEPSGFTGVSDALKIDNYETAKLTLAQVGKVPDDATVVVVGGPQTDFLAPEIEALKAYLAKGGKLQLLLDPPDKGAPEALPNLFALAHDWGVDVGNDMLIDTSGLGQIIGTQNAAVPVAMPVQHAITKDFRKMTGFPLARSITPVAGGVSGHTAQTVLETSPQSWAESDLKGLFATGKPEQDPSKGDKNGPISIAAAVSAAAAQPPAGAAADAPKPETRVVVVGDSDFVSNSIIGLQGNKEIYLNMINWLAQQEDLIAIRPKSPEDRPVTMTAAAGEMVFWGLLAFSAALMGNGFRVWWRRR